MPELEWLAIRQRVDGLPVIELDPDPPVLVPEAENETRESVRQPRRQGQPVLIVADTREAPTAAITAPASEAMCSPSRVLCSRSCRSSSAASREVVVGEFEMPDLGGDHRLRAGRQRRVAHRDRLVVREVARLLLEREGVAPQVHRQHEVGLLDDLLAVEVEVREVEQQRVLVGRRRLEVPVRVLGEPLDCGCTPSSSSYGIIIAAAASRQRGRLLGVDAELAAARVGVARGRVGGPRRFRSRHQVRVDVVVGDRAVLVRAGHAVDAEPSRRVVVAERTPQPGRLDEQLETHLALELLVPGGVDVADRRRRRCPR